jgi:hypothetical protein
MVKVTGPVSLIRNGCNRYKKNQTTDKHNNIKTKTCANLRQLVQLGHALDFLELDVVASLKTVSRLVQQSHHTIFILLNKCYNYHQKCLQKVKAIVGCLSDGRDQFGDGRLARGIRAHKQIAQIDKAACHQSTNIG